MVTTPTITLQLLLGHLLLGLKWLLGSMISSKSGLQVLHIIPDPGESRPSIWPLLASNGSISVGVICGVGCQPWICRPIHCSPDLSLDLLARGACYQWEVLCVDDAIASSIDQCIHRRHEHLPKNVCPVMPRCAACHHDCDAQIVTDILQLVGHNLSKLWLTE